MLGRHAGLGPHRCDRARPRGDVRRSLPRHSPERTRRQRPRSRCGRSCSSASTARGRCARRPTAQASSSAACSRTSASARATWTTESLPIDLATRVTDHVAGMTIASRCAASRSCCCHWPRRAASGRLTAASLEAVKKERSDIVELIRPDTELRKAEPSGSVAAPSTRNARRRSTSIPASGSTTATVATWAATPSRTCARVTRSTSWAPSSGSPSASTCRWSTRRRARRWRLAAAVRTAGAHGADGRVLPRPCGESPLAEGARALPDGARRRLGDGRALPAGILGGRAPGHRRSPQARLRRSRARGDRNHQAAPAPRGGVDPHDPGASCSRSSTSAGARSPSRAGGCRPTSPRGANNLPQSLVLHKSSSLYGLHLARTSIAKAEGRRSSSRATRT